MRGVIAFCVILLLAGTVNATGVPQEFIQEFEIERLEEGLPADAQDLMENVSIRDHPDFLQNFLGILQHAIQKCGEFAGNTRRMMLRFLAIIILCRLNASIGDGRFAYIGRISGALALMVLSMSDLSSMMGAGKKTIEEMASFTHLLLPIITSVSCAAGSATGSAGIYAVTVFFSDLLLHFCGGVLLPGIYACAGMAMADCLLGQERLKRAWMFLKWSMELGLKGITYGFSAIVSLTGILAGGADAIVLKGVKSAIAVMVPVVGGIISGAADTVLSSASLLKNAVGVFGMLGVIAICLLPFLELGISWLLFRGISAISAMLGSGLTGLLDAISSMMGVLLGMVGSCAWIVMLACCCYVKVVHL